MSHQLPVTGNTEHTRPENRAFYPALDGLRALAFLFVFFTHYNGMAFGWSGVDIFFVLSGFLITGILFDSCDDPHRARNFYVRRTLRIFPLYYGIMLLFLLSDPFLHWRFTWGWLVWPLYLGNYARFIHPYAQHSAMESLANFQPTAHGSHHHTTLFLGHFWSLCVEEQFYLFWPWLVFWIRDRRKLLWICSLTLPFCLLLRWVANHTAPQWMLGNELLYRATPFRLDALLLGGLLALVLRGPRSQLMLQLNRKIFPVVMGVLLLCIALSHTPLLHGFSFAENFQYWWGITVIDLMAAVAILEAIQPGTLAYRALSFRPLRWLGRISYGAYVLHDIPHGVYRRFVEVHFPAHPTRVTAIVGFTMTILMAWLSFRFFESPFLDLKERWTIRKAN